MKRGGKIALNIVMILVCVALFVGAISYWALNKTSAANRLRSKAKNEYFDREFLMAYHTYHGLIDSLKVSDEAASINYANSAFMSSKALKNGLYGSTRGKVGGIDAEVNDQTKDSLFDFSQAEYLRLSSAKNNTVA